MKKSIKVTAVAAAMTIAMAATAFAAPFAFTGTWQGGTGANVNRWWYAKDAAKTTWYAGTTTMPYWVWIDGNKDGVAECYAFDAQGWMYQNTTTPDNYTVNVNGAWTVNGYVQTQASTNFTMVSNSSSSSSSGGSGSSTTSAAVKQAAEVAAVAKSNVTAIQTAVENTGDVKVTSTPTVTTSGSTVVVKVNATKEENTTTVDAIDAMAAAVESSNPDTSKIEYYLVGSDDTHYTYDEGIQAAKDKAAAYEKATGKAPTSGTITAVYTEGAKEIVKVTLD